MIRRKAVTLMEVLIAIFVMGIGLLAMLALFPIGALSMAQAIKDERAAQASINAGNIASVWKTRTDPAVTAPPNAYANPGSPGLPDLDTLPRYSGPSYPVFVDPIGYQQFLSPYQQWVAGMDGVSSGTPPGIPRRSVSFVLPPPPVGPPYGTSLNPARDTYRWFTLLDDVSFAENGVPDTSSGFVQRDGRYSWAYLCRMRKYTPAASAPPYYTVPPAIIDLSVVVYSGRSLDLSASFHPLGETAYQATATSNYTLTLNWNPNAGQERPAVRKGTWLLDATVDPYSQQTGGFFYRAVNVTEPGSGGSNSIDVEIQSSLRTTPVNWVVVMENVVEVFDKGAGF